MHPEVFSHVCFCHASDSSQEILAFKVCESHIAARSSMGQSLLFEAIQFHNFGFSMFPGQTERQGVPAKGMITNGQSVFSHFQVSVEGHRLFVTPFRCSSIIMLGVSGIITPRRGLLQIILEFQHVTTILLTGRVV